MQMDRIHIDRYHYHTLLPFEEYLNMDIGMEN